MRELVQHAGAESTVKMITIGQEQLHPAEDDEAPPGRRLWNGGAGRRRRRRLQFGVGWQALQVECARQDLRAFRPPAAVFFEPCLTGHLKEVLWCSWLVLDRV